MAVRRHWHRSINVPQVKRTPIRAFFLLYKAQPNNHVPAVDCLSWYHPPMASYTAKPLHWASNTRFRSEMKFWALYNTAIRSIPCFSAYWAAEAR